MPPEIPVARYGGCNIRRGMACQQGEQAMTGTARQQPDAGQTEQARQHLKKAEAGEGVGAAALGETRKADPAGEQAAEREALDGPEGRGLSR
jgi:hypothetical protein